MDAKMLNTGTTLYTKVGSCMWMQMCCCDVHSRQGLRDQDSVYVAVAINEIDQWDTECFKVKQAKDDHKSRILAGLKDPKCRAIIFK